MFYSLLLNYSFSLMNYYSRIFPNELLLPSEFQDNFYKQLCLNKSVNNNYIIYIYNFLNIEIRHNITHFFMINKFDIGTNNEVKSR